MGAETSQRPGKEAAGSRHEPEHVRQTATANTESIGPQTHELIEEVLRRENLLKALRRVVVSRIKLLDTGVYSSM